MLKIKEIQKKGSLEWKRKISEALKGKHHTEEAKGKMSLAKMGKKRKPFTEETKEKMKINNAKYWKGKHHTEKAKEKNRQAHLGKIVLEETKKKISKSHYGEKNGRWKGNSVKCGGVHRWVKEYKPKPQFCEFCKENKSLDLANIKNHQYTRNPDDYKWLCRSCHLKYDYKNRKRLLCEFKEFTCEENPLMLVSFLQKPLNKRLGEKIDTFEGYEKVQKNIPVNTLINELRDLRGL